MFTVECDGQVFYNDSATTELGSLIDPKLQLVNNAAGNFTCIVPTANVAYNSINKIISTIVVKREGTWLWEGRVLTDQTDFYGRKTINCEGALAYLNDTILLPKKYTVSSVYNLLSQLLSVHNSKVPNSRKIYIGSVTVSPSDFPSSFQTNYENVLTFIKENLVDLYGGYLRVRKDGSTLKLDYYKDCPKTASQEVDFGTNLVEFTKAFDFTKICTVVIPRGKQLSDQENEDGSPKYLTIESVNGNSPYLVNTTTLNTYGRVEKVVEFNDVEDANLLLRLGRAYLSNYQFENMVLTVKAIDLHILNSSIGAFDMLDSVRCKSIPHGLDKYMPITSMDIPLNSPENLQYTFGIEENTSISNTVSSISSGTKSELDKTPTRDSVLEEALSNAQSILTQATTGYVNIVQESTYSEALIVSNNKDWHQASQYWKFNMNGLGYFKNGKLSGIAITMDGKIVADFITTGTLNANLVKVVNLDATSIKAGSITATQISVGYTKMWQDADSTTLVKVDAVDKKTQAVRTDLNAEIRLRADQIATKVTKGQINSSIEQSAEKIYIRANKFGWESTYSSLTTDGKLKANYASFTNCDVSGKITSSSGKIGGFTITNMSLYNGTSSLSSGTQGVYVGTDGIYVNGYQKFKASINMGISMDVANMSYLKVSDNSHGNMLEVGNGMIHTGGHRGSDYGAVKIPIEIDNSGAVTANIVVYLRAGLLCTS